MLRPASVCLLFLAPLFAIAAALALDHLRPDYRIKTSLHAVARLDKSGTLRGDLLAYGRGDPSFAERFDGGSYTDVLRPIVNAIAAAGNARAKTGTLRHVNTLSGYLTTKAGENLAFSLMLNNYAGDDARGAPDAIVVLLAAWEQR